LEEGNDRREDESDPAHSIAAEKKTKKRKQSEQVDAADHSPADCQRSRKVIKLSELGLEWRLR
jgi:hypothetical protein